MTKEVVWEEDVGGDEVLAVQCEQALRRCVLTEKNILTAKCLYDNKFYSKFPHVKVSCCEISDSDLSCCTVEKLL